MSSAKLTLIGLYHWLENEHIDMFESFKFLPDGIDVSVLSNMILSEGGEFEPLYANAYMMKDNVQMFVMNHLRTFNKWMDALNIEYNPLENYDRMEEWHDNGTSDSNVNNNSTSHSNASTNASSDGSTSGNATNNVSAYDSSTMSPHDSSNTSTTTHTSGGNSSNATTVDNGTSTEHGSTSNERTGRTHGNIGVTTSQQMLQSELDIARFNVYHQITDLFIDELLIGVYI